MAAGTRGVDGGSNGDGGEPARGWRAEEAIAGNRMALQALRELVVYPFLYAPARSPAKSPTRSPAKSLARSTTE
jgi:hypothetical protein